MKNWLIGGTFDMEGGKPSKLVQSLYDSLGDTWHLINGGTIQELQKLANTDIKSGLDTLIWMPNISNDENKLLPHIKAQNPSLHLIQSKRVVEKKYTLQDIKTRLQASQATHCIMIAQDEITKTYLFSLINDLGGIVHSTSNIQEIGQCLNRYVFNK